MTEDIRRVVFRSQSPSELIRYAIEAKADIEQLERLYALQQKWDADQAKRAYVAAMAEAKAHARVSYSTLPGTTERSQMALSDEVTTVVPWLARHGFSHHWSVRQENGLVYVTCILAHEKGHSESCEMFAAPDESGGKNAIQSIVSTETYLESHTLLAAIGLITWDDDARARDTEQSSVNAQNSGPTQVPENELPLHMPFKR